jgi:hypothetical protein
MAFLHRGSHGCGTWSLRIRSRMFRAMRLVAICRELFAVFLFQELFRRQVAIVRFGVHPSFHSSRHIKRTLSRSDDDKPLFSLGTVVPFEQPKSSSCILHLSMRTTRMKRRLPFARYEVVVAAGEVLLDLEERIRRCVHKLINARSLFIDWRKYRHLSYAKSRLSINPEEGHTR